MQAVPPIKLHPSNAELVHTLYISYPDKYRARVVYVNGEGKEYPTDYVLCEGLCALNMIAVPKEITEVRIEVEKQDGMKINEQVSFATVSCSAYSKALEELPAVFATSGFLLILADVINKVVLEYGGSKEVYEGSSKAFVLPVPVGGKVNVYAVNPKYYFLY